MVPDSGRKHRLTSCKASGDGVHGVTLGRHVLPEGIVEESLCLLSCRRLVVEFLVVPVCSYVLLAMVSSATIDLAVVVWLS